MINFLWMYTRSLKKEECEQIIDHCIKNYHPEIASIGGNGPETIISSYRSCSLRRIDYSDHEIVRKIVFYILDSNSYNFKFNINYLLDEELNFLDYNKTDQDKYDWHEDYVFFEEKNTCRKLTCIIQLTDKNDYEGCDLEFFKSGKTVKSHELREQGTVIIFPSFVPHRITPITKGTRHSLVSWWSGPAFK